MKFRFITFSDSCYKEERMLRWEVLEKPLGISPVFECSLEEKKSFHLIAVDENQLVGCVLCYPESDTEGKIFDLVVGDQKKGFARQMVSKLEDFLQRKGIG